MGCVLLVCVESLKGRGGLVSCCRGGMSVWCIVG